VNARVDNYVNALREKETFRNSYVIKKLETTFTK